MGSDPDPDPNSNANANANARSNSSSKSNGNVGGNANSVTPRATPRSLQAVARALPADRYRILAGTVAVAAGLVVFWLATDLFPYHSINHDEGVYLQQAAMLLEGRLYLRPGSAALREAVHPWFFVESESGLYPKYAPVPAAVFALGELAGGYRLSLLAVATANVACCYGIASGAFDRRTGILAAATMAAAPLFLLTSAVFLPYAPTTALNLLFAFAYVRSVRRESTRWAALAGVAIGLAFFARPYTALLFAAPFVLHACWQLSGRPWRTGDPKDRPSPARPPRSPDRSVASRSPPPSAWRSSA